MKLVFDSDLEKKVRKLIASWGNTDAKKMFGGICFLINGNMFSGIYKDFVFLRLGKEASQSALKLPFVKPFDITGKPMKGWVMITKDGINTDENLKNWLNKARAFAKSLPPKN